jgi:4-amino-4-deoxy-L-arabinose transferase-like glycosyltransferase
MWDEADNLGVLMESADAGHPSSSSGRGSPTSTSPTSGTRSRSPRSSAWGGTSWPSGGHRLRRLLPPAPRDLHGRRLFGALPGLAAGAFLLAIRQNFFFKPGHRFSTHHFRSADADTLMILFLFASFALLVARVRGWRPGLWLAAAATGLGLLAKGPWALMAFAGFALFELLSAQRVALSRRELGLAALAFGVVALPWHLAMLWLWRDAFVQQYLAYVFQRVASGLPGHSPDPLYYLSILGDRAVFFGLPLSCVAVAAVLVQRKKLPRVERAGTLLTLACLAAVLQASKTKIAWYVLPCIPSWPWWWRRWWRTCRSSPGRAPAWVRPSWC